MKEKESLVSLLFHMTFFLLVFTFLLQLWMIPKLNGLHILAVVTIVISFIHVTMQAETIAFAYYKKLIIFSCTVMMLPIANGIYVNKKLVDWVLGINLSIAALYIVMYWGFGVRGYVDVYLCLNFSNPNLTGMFLLHSLLYCAIAFYRYRHWFVRAVIVVLFLALFWLLKETGTRSAILALIGFGAFAIFNVVLKKDVRISPAMSFVLILAPLLIAFVYLGMAKSGILEKWFSSFSARGKNLHSREAIWEYVLAYYERSPVIGAYYDISGGRGMSQMHNTHLDVLVSYGTVPFVLFILTMHAGVRKILDEARSEFGHMCIFAFYAVLLLGTFEAALVSGGVGLYVLSFGFLILARYDEQEEMLEEGMFVPADNQGSYLRARRY